MSTTLKLSILPESSNVSVQLLNPTYDSFYRALATSVFAQHTGFNLGFGCSQYNPPPNESLVIGLHNFSNHKIQVGLAKWLRMYLGGFALKELELEKGPGFTNDMREGDFSDLRNDGRLIPSLKSLLNFMGEMYSAMLASDFGKIHLPEDVIMKFNEFLQPPMSKASWIHHTQSWDEAKAVRTASEFLRSRNVCVFIPEQNVSDKLSFPFYNSTSLYSGMIPPPADIDRYGDKSGSVQIKIPPNILLENSRLSERDVLEKCHCLLRTRHSFGGKIMDGYHVVFPLTCSHVDMSLRQRYHDITKELIKNLPRTLQSKIMVNYADVTILSQSSASSVKGSSSSASSVKGSASSVRGTSSASSVRDTSSSASSVKGSASSVRGSASSVRDSASSVRDSASSVRGSASSSSSSASSVRGSASSVKGSASSVRGAGSSAVFQSPAFSDDDNDGEEDTVEKKKSMDSLVKSAFELGKVRMNKSSSPTLEEILDRSSSPAQAQVYKIKNYCSEDSSESE